MRECIQSFAVMSLFQQGLSCLAILFTLLKIVIAPLSFHTLNEPSPLLLSFVVFHSTPHPLSIYNFLIYYMYRLLLVSPLRPPGQGFLSVLFIYVSLVQRPGTQ